MANSFATSYLGGHPEAREFLPPLFREPEGRREAVVLAARRRCLPEVHAALTRQNAAWGMSDARQKHLDALARPGTVVVATGQQVGLFLGPLYTFYKAASAIAIARQLQEETGATVVPLFWLQTEDHDFAEIAGCTVPQRGQTPLHLSIADDASLQARQSVAHRRLDQRIEGVLEQLAQSLEALPHADEVLALLGQHYRDGAGVSDAFAAVLAKVFAEEGLLLLDPREPALAPLAVPIHRQILAQTPAIATRLHSHAEALQQAGFRIQVPVHRERALSFFHPDGPTGSRFRLVQQDGHWALAGHPLECDKTQLDAFLDEEPLRFSTSALLRPLLQDSWLPTAAYVGGPGEISYFAQLPPLYEQFGLPLPLVIPRGRFVLMEPHVVEGLAQFGLSLDDLQQPEPILLERMELAHAPHLAPERLLARLWEPFSTGLQELEKEMLALEPGLAKAVEKTQRGVENCISKLSHKVQRVRLHQAQQSAQKLSMLRERLWPQGAPQERVFSLPYFAARYGLDTLKATLFAGYEPFSAGLRELYL